MNENSGLPDPPEREKKPKVNDLGQHEICCADCDTILLIMMQTEETDLINKIKVENCPKCGGESWINTLIGKYFYAQVTGVTIKSMEFDDEKELMRIRMT